MPYDGKAVHNGIAELLFYSYLLSKPQGDEAVRREEWKRSTSANIEKCVFLLYSPSMRDCGKDTINYSTATSFARVLW